MEDDKEYYWNFTTKKETTYGALNWWVNFLSPIYEVRLGPPMIMDDHGEVAYQPQYHKEGRIGLYVKEPSMKNKFPSLEEALDWAAKHHNINKDKLKLKM